MRITKNFSFWEFGPRGCAHNWVPDNEHQKMLVEDLALNLQKLRNEANRIRKANVSIYISSGIRSIADHYRLQGAGFNPAETSDHFFGVSVPVIKGGKHHLKFGDTYNFSVGAADCIISGMNTMAFSRMAMEEHREGVVQFGQIIYEKNPVKKSEWVHLSNAYGNYFSDRIVSWLNKTPFLQSLDGGISYQVANVK